MVSVYDSELTSLHWFCVRKQPDCRTGSCYDALQPLDGLLITVILFAWSLLRCVHNCNTTNKKWSLSYMPVEKRYSRCILRKHLRCLSVYSLVQFICVEVRSDRGPPSPLEGVITCGVTTSDAGVYWRNKGCAVYHVIHEYLMDLWVSFHVQ